MRKWFVTECTMLVLACAPVALYAAQRTFVASTGNDASNCTLPAPCRAFAAAIALADANGEVIVLDSAGYGSVTITKPIAIIAPPGVYAGISVFSGGDGVAVTAASADKVVLRGLTINGLGGTSGIRVTSGGQVRIEGCAVTNMLDAGVRIEGGAAVYIDDTLLQGNGQQGLRIASGTAAVYVGNSRFYANSIAIVQEAGTLTLTHVRMENNNWSVYIHPTDPGTYTTLVQDSLITGSSVPFETDALTGMNVNLSVVRTSIVRNGSTGFNVVTTPGGTINVVIADSHIDHNYSGVNASGAGTTLSLSGSTVSSNTLTGLMQMNSATFVSLGNNAVEGNGTSTAGTITNHGLQ